LDIEKRPVERVLATRGRQDQNQKEAQSMSKGEKLPAKAAQELLAGWRDEPYPPGAQYADLYANYDPAFGQESDESSQRLLDLCGPLAGVPLLDIGAGMGGLSLLAARRGARPLALDQEAEMLQKDALRAAGVPWSIQSIADFCRDWPAGSFGAACARQSANYFAKTLDWGLFAGLLSARGVFAFNTFEMAQDSPEFAARRWVGADGVERVDARQVRDGRVWHAQKAGDAVHYTAFDALSPEEFEALLSPLFECSRERVGASWYWRAAKK